LRDVERVRISQHALRIGHRPKHYSLNSTDSRDYNLFTLAFKNASLEQAFFSHSYERTLVQGRIGLVVGTMLYLLFGLFDRWSIPAEHLSFAWTVRIIALSVPISIFALTFTSHFRKASHAYLASLGFAANIGFLFIFALIPIDKLALFYPSIALTTVATYFLVGTRFVYALAAELTIFAAFNLLFINLHGITSPTLITTLLIQDFFLLSANVIGGAAGYMQELQNRHLFLRETELEQERQHHLRRSLHDPLTKLPNRDLLCDRIQQALAQSHRDNSTHAAFFIDLDGFKAINDHQGHEVGDKVLQTVAAQLSINVRDTDTVARLGGDEFFVLCQSISGITEAKQQALRLLNAIEQISSMGTVTDRALCASVGICMLPYPGNTVTDILKRTDKAMYKAKKSGGKKYAMSSTRQADLVH
jgi:diguanylate cyclase